MGTIRIEYTPVQQYNLGLLNVSHLQLVFQDETSFVDRQDRAYVAKGPSEQNMINVANRTRTP